jgi:hypothetical protein
MIAKKKQMNSNELIPFEEELRTPQWERDERLRAKTHSQSLPIKQPDGSIIQGSHLLTCRIFFFWILNINYFFLVVVTRDDEVSDSEEMKTTDESSSTLSQNVNQSTEMYSLKHQLNHTNSNLFN